MTLGVMHRCMTAAGNFAQTEFGGFACGDGMGDQMTGKGNPPKMVEQCDAAGRLGKNGIAWRTKGNFPKTGFLVAWLCIFYSLCLLLIYPILILFSLV